MTESTHRLRSATGDQERQVDVVIVGAGISGLATAEALVGAGVGVAVLEARPRTGGRLLSTPLDLGATWFWHGEQRVLDLTRRLNIATHPQHLAGDTIVEDLRGVQRYPGNMIDAPAYCYHGGAATVTDALAAALPAGIVHLDHPVEQIACTKTDDATSSSQMAVTSRGRDWHAQHVVLALPPAVATIRLPVELPAALTRLAAQTPVWMGQTVKVATTSLSGATTGSPEPQPADWDRCMRSTTCPAPTDNRPRCSGSPTRSASAPIPIRRSATSSAACSVPGPRHRASSPSRTGAPRRERVLHPSSLRAARAALSPPPTACSAIPPTCDQLWTVSSTGPRRRPRPPTRVTSKALEAAERTVAAIHVQRLHTHLPAAPRTAASRTDQRKAAS